MRIGSKTFLEEINNNINNHLCCNQWRSTSIVIEWFRATKNSVNSLNLTLQSFTHQYWWNYLKNLLTLYIIKIENKVINIVKPAKKSLLFHDGKAWVRKEENPLFDVTMGG